MCRVRSVDSLWCALPSLDFGDRNSDEFRHSGIRLRPRPNDVEAFIQVGFKSGTTPGWMDMGLHEDNVNDLVEITLEFASK